MTNNSLTCHTTNEQRLTDVDVLIRTFADIHSAHYDITYEGLIRVLKDAPTVDAVEVVHGRWETIEGREYLGCLCSNCQKWSDAKTNYCPNCGAKMDGDGNGQYLL